MQRLILLVCVLSLPFIACRKGSLPDEYYFGKVNISEPGVSDAHSLDIYFENEKIGTILPTGSISTFTFPANKAGKLSIYKESTDSLVADTMITVLQNASVNIRVIYSSALGIKGFLSSDSNIAADSVKLQFMYNFDSPFNAYPEVDLYVLDADRIDTVAVVSGLKNGQLGAKAVTLVHLKDGNGLIYYCMLKDVATGEFIKQKSKNRNFFSLITGDAAFDGHLSIIQLYDNDGDETTNKILTTTTTL